MTIANITNEDLDFISKPSEKNDNDKNDLLAKALAYKEKPIEKTKENIERPPFYSYPDYYNIFPCYIAPNLDENGEKITKFGKWESYITEKYPKEKLQQDIININNKEGIWNSLAVMGGQISGNLIILDFDLVKGYNSEEFFNKIIKLLPILSETLTEKSYRWGYHFHLLVDDMSCYKSLEKKLIKETVFGSCCNEVGVRGENKLTFIWSGKKYRVINKVPPLKITNKEFLKILKPIYITTPKIKKETKLTVGNIVQVKVDDKLPKIFDVLDECHRDVLSHKIDIAEYCKKTKAEEFEYHKDLYWQVWTKLSLTHESLYPYLKKQSHFNIKKIETQLKYDYHNYKLPFKTKNNPKGFIKASVKKLYPDYPKKQPKKKKIKEKEIVYDAYEIADSILQTHTIKTLGNKKADYCLYNNGVYERGQLNKIEAIISDTLKELDIPFSLTKNYELLKLIANATYIDIKEFDKNKMVLNLSNGLLNIETLELTPHTPEYLSFRRIPITYDSKAKCIKIRKFLKEIFHSEDIKYILEKVGLSLTPIMVFQDGTFLFGTGNNGKTTFYNLLRKLLGTNNYSGVDLIKLDGFIFSQIENKLANIVSDTDSSQKINIQNYKIYVGNELVVYINRKFLEPYQVPPTAKMWYSCNTSFPQVPLDTDKGFWRKITIIECPFEFDNIEVLNILEELTTPEELSGFLNLAIRNLRTLLRREKFSLRYTNWEYYKDFWLTKNNILGQFVKETMLIGSQYYTDKQETLKCMNTWLVNNGKTPITDKKLTSMIKGIPKYYHERLTIDKKQTWLYTGFSIKDDIREIPDYYLKKRKKLKTKFIDDFKK